MIRACNLFFIFAAILLLGMTPAWAKNTLSIEISGVNDDVRQNIIERLTEEQQSYGKKLSDDEIQDFFQAAPSNIHKALEPYGYFKSKIQSHLSENDSTWAASFIIQPGPQIKINVVEIKILGPGKDNLALQKLISTLPIKSGDIFQTQNYEKTKETLFQTANNQGYLKAVLEKKQIRIDLHDDSATIILWLNTGPRYYLGEVTFGENPFSTVFLQRFIPFRRDDPFSSEKLLKFQQALSSSHYFQEVVVTPDLKHVQNYHVPIQVTLKAPKSKRFSFGIGYGTVTGARFIAKADFRRLTNTGHHLSTELNVSSVLRAFTATYYIPGKKPLKDQYTLGANIQKFMPKNGNSFSETLSAGYQKKHKVWHRSYSLHFLNEQYNIDGQPYRHSQLLYPSVSVSRTKMDDRLFPRNGSTINLTLQGGSKQLVSATNFIQGEAKGKYIYSPFSIGRFILRGDVGYTIANKLDKNMPLTMQYFAGGTDSIRGYPDSEFGPGRYLLVGSIEYQHQIIGNWHGAVFYDKGTATDHFGGPYNVGDGFGVIYQSFVGPLRLYFARAETRKGKPWSVELNIGADL